MRWLPNHRRPRLLRWRASTQPSVPTGDRRRLCALLSADTLDDLVRVACEEAAATSGISRLFVVGWNAHMLGPWAIFPHTSVDRVLSTALEERLTAGRDRVMPDAPDEAMLAEAKAMGFDGMAFIPSRRHLVFQVMWSSAQAGSCIDLRDDSIWPDLEMALCNFARLDQVRELSYIDTLTGLFNRRFFNLRLKEEVARAGRFTRPLALAICDLDRFKQLNDTHGHQAGDVILRYMAQTLRRSVRTIDIVSRLGGDEFAVLMPDTDAEECGLLAQRLIEAVAGGGFTLGGPDAGVGTLDLRMSVGGAVFPGHADRPERLLWCSDMALLEAKRAGGYRFVLCDPARIKRGTAV